MAFFDDLGAMLSKTGQKTVQKANELADITKLNLRTGELNKSVRELYAQLGEQYYVRFHGEPHEALAETCGAIDKLNEELERIRLEIQRIKQIKVCPSCGHENESDARFCCKCSEPLPEHQQQDASVEAGRTCPQCGAPALENALFCTKCGTRFPSDEPPQLLDGQQNDEQD